MPLVKSDTVTMQVSLSNAAPLVGAISCTPSSLTPSAGVNTTVFCNATLTDTNGWNDINQSSMNATFYLSATPKDAADDLNIHYSNGSLSSAGTACTFTGGSGNTVEAQCNFTTRYFITPGTWTVNFTVNDTAGDMAISNSTSYTVETILGLNIVESLVNFGSLSLSETSTEKTTTLQNLGNTLIDVNLSMAGGILDCPDPYSDLDIDGTDGIRYNLTTSFTFTQGIALTDTATPYTEFDANYYNATGTADGTTSKDLYWLLRVPASGVGGTCTGTTTIVATTST